MEWLGLAMLGNERRRSYPAQNAALVIYHVWLTYDLARAEIK